MTLKRAVCYPAFTYSIFTNPNGPNYILSPSPSCGSAWSTSLKYRLFSSYQLNAHFLYSTTIYMLRYNPQRVSNSTLLIFRRTNCIITASGIVTLCTRPYSMPVESSALNRHTVWPFTESHNLSSWRWARYCSKHVEDYNVTYILL